MTGAAQAAGCTEDWSWYGVDPCKIDRAVRSDLDAGEVAADTFIVGQYYVDNTVNKVSWLGRYMTQGQSTSVAVPTSQTPAVTPFTVSLYDTYDNLLHNGNKAPTTTPLVTFAVMPTRSLSGYSTWQSSQAINPQFTPDPLYLFEAVLPSTVNLQNGNYGIAIVADTTADPTSTFIWAATSQGFTGRTHYSGYGPYFASGHTNFAWSSVQHDMAFRLSYDPSGVVNALPSSPAPVPEPESWALMVLGLATLSAVARRRARHDAA